MKKLKDLSESDRPREKLQAKGPEALSDLELLASLLGTGTRDSDVLTVAGRILKAIDGGNDQVSLDKLQEIEGVGPAKAALEFARRRIRPEGLRISFPPDALPLIRHFADRRQEHFICVSLNGANEVIATRVVSVGLVDKTQVHPREVFADPITDRASAVIVAHNHPSGSLEPSREDHDITARLKSAGEILGIRLLDHIVFNQRGYYSFLEKGLLKNSSWQPTGFGGWLYANRKDIYMDIFFDNYIDNT
jgi:DNA repair protein RadC